MASLSWVWFEQRPRTPTDKPIVLTSFDLTTRGLPFQRVGVAGLCTACDLNVPFPSAREADIVYNSLRVDKEPKKGGTCKTLSVKGDVLHVHFEAKEARMLRVAVNGFMDHLVLVTQTIEQFGPPVETS